MNLTESVRREAKRRGSPDRAALRSLPADAWKATESALVAEVRAHPKRARPLVDAFARLARAAGTSEARGRAARLRGSWLSYVGRDREAVVPYRDAIRRLAGVARAGARLGLASSLNRLGRHAESSRLCARLRAEAASLGEPVLAALADLNDGVARHESGDARAAAVRYRRARTALAAAGQRAMAAQATQNLANALVLTEGFDEAESLYAEAAAELSALGLVADAAACRANRAWLLALTDRLGEADAELRRAEADFGTVGAPVQAALARRDRGDVLLRAGLVPEARHALATSLRALRRGAPPIEIARTHLLTARAAVAAGDTAAATRALGAVRASSAEVLEIRGRIAAVRGRDSDAVALLRRAAKLYGASLRLGAVRSLAAAVWCADAAGAPGDSGIGWAADAERAAAAAGVPSARFAASAARFLAETRSHRGADADRSLERAAAALEEVRAGLGPEAMRSALLRGREAWLARAVGHLLGRPDGPRRALAFLERWRARSLLDLLADARSGRDEPGRAAALRRVVAALEKRAEGAPAPGFLRAPLAPLPTVLRRLRAAERDLLRELARDAAAAAPFTERDLDAVRSGIEDGVLVVAPVAADDRTLLLVVSRDGVRAVPSPADPADVAAATAQTHHALGAWTLGGEYVQRHEPRLRRGVEAAFARLGDAFVGPLSADLRGARRLVVLPHASWHHVPFAALPFGGRPLVARLPVTMLPALGALRDAPAPATGESVVVAVPDEAAPSVRAEAEAVARTTGARLVAGADATSDALLALDGPACLHVAAHGRHRPDAPHASGVRLADGWFRAAEFAHVRLRGAVVVLSGCETGLMEIDAGDEALGLVRGVLAAGATDVVSSLWRIDDHATAAFMSRLHELRATGVPPGEALAATQREHAAAGAPPWHWAGFVHHARRV